VRTRVRMKTRVMMMTRGVMKRSTGVAEDALEVV
jgi:hypothetical protein